MHFMPVTMDINIDQLPENHYVVVHPLDDRVEEKIDTLMLGPMPMTTSVKLSLMALRGYLILMVVLLGYHCLDLAGAFGKS